MKIWFIRLSLLALVSPFARAAQTKSSFWITSKGAHVRTQVSDSPAHEFTFNESTVLKKFTPMIEQLLGPELTIRKTSSALTIANSKGETFQFQVSRETGGWKIDVILTTQTRLGAETLMGITRFMRVHNEELAHAGLGVSRELGNS